MLVRFGLLCALQIVKISSQDISSLVDVKTLSELPLAKLLTVRNTFTADGQVPISAGGGPEALPLQAKRKQHDRGGYYVHYAKSSEKKGVKSIFQVSVTALAFLAFGGYLLCLLVQAIRGKQTAMGATTMMPSAALFRPIVKRRRPTRRPERVAKPSRGPTVIITATNRRPKREVAEEEMERMYVGLVQLSEAYANYHTMDYNRLNRTNNYLRQNY